jgi:hypothetical protein
VREVGLKPRVAYLIFLCSVALGGLTAFLPIAQMVVRVVVAQSTGYVYPPQQTTICFWETGIPISDPTMASQEPSDTICAAPVAKDTTGNLQRVLVFWQLVGWGSISANIVVWLKFLLVCRNKDGDQKRQLVRLASTGLLLGLIGVAALCILGPPVHCPPAVVGVDLEQVKVFWPTLLIGATSLVLGITASASWSRSL